MQHTRARTVVLIAILEKVVDDHGVPSWQIQLEGQRTRRELPAILDVIVAMVWVPFKDKPRRAFVCQSDTYPVKDRSGRLDPIEEPNLGKLLAKLSIRQARRVIMVNIFNAQKPRDNFAPVPANVVAPMLLLVKRGPDGGALTPSNSSDARYLNCEFIFTDGPHKGARAFPRLVVEGSSDGCRRRSRSVMA